MAKTCPKCGTQNRDLARFCQNCRQALEMICPNCGMINASKANFCSSCGTSFQTGSQPLAAAAPGIGAANAAPVPGGAIPGANVPAQMAIGLVPGTILDGRYCIEKRLGGGGMGAVYLALDQRLGIRWAIKEMSDSALTDPLERQHAVQAFENEARLLANLDHYNLPRVNNHFQENGKYYLVMDYIDGQTLDAMIEDKLNAAAQGLPAQPFHESQVLKWAEELCSVLSYLHSQNPPIIFRDLKPGNIMVEKNGRLRLIDFGVARLFKPGKSKDTASFGTRGFAPPEQYGKGQTDARSDIYALGATMHFLLTLRDPGDDPFHFQPVQSLNALVSKGTSDAIDHAVKFERVDRWSTAGEFLKALKGSIPAPTTSADASASASTPAGSGSAVRGGPAAGVSGSGAKVSPPPPVKPGVVVTPPAAAASSAASVGTGAATAHPPVTAVNPPVTTVQATKSVRRSNLLGYVFWVVLSTALGFLLVTTLMNSGLPWHWFLIHPMSVFQLSYNDMLSKGLVMTAVMCFPQLLALLRTRLPGAFTLPIVLLYILSGSGMDYIAPVFAGLVMAEFLLLIQNYNPKSFWRLYFATVTAQIAANYFVYNTMVAPEYYLSVAAGAALACIVGRVISNIAHWDS